MTFSSNSCLCSVVGVEPPEREDRMYISIPLGVNNVLEKSIISSSGLFACCWLNKYGSGENDVQVTAHSRFDDSSLPYPNTSQCELTKNNHPLPFQSNVTPFVLFMSYTSITKYPLLTLESSSRILSLIISRQPHTEIMMDVPVLAFDSGPAERLCDDTSDSNFVSPSPSIGLYVILTSMHQPERVSKPSITLYPIIRARPKETRLTPRLLPHGKCRPGYSPSPHEPCPIESTRSVKQ